MIKSMEEISSPFLQNIDLVCFSHLRWGFVYQRPQHLLSRFAKQTRVYFIEEPVYHNDPDKFVITEESKNLFIMVPHLKKGDSEDLYFRLKQLITSMYTSLNISRYFSWYYTPMALPFTDHLKPELIVYDCMDELSAFKFAPPQLTILEKELLKKADVVFTGGQSIYEAKKRSHHNIHAF